MARPSEPSAVIPRGIEGRATEQADLQIDAIRPSTLNPRKHFDESALLDLVASVSEHGVLEPLVVRYIGDPAQRYKASSFRSQETAQPVFELIAGERRWRAARIAGLAVVPCVIREVANDREALTLALVENIMRRDIDPIEEAEGYRALAAMGHTQTEIAATVGRSQAAIGNALRILKLPESVQTKVREGVLTVAHGKALARLADFPAVAEKMVEFALRHNLPTKQLENGLVDPWGLQQDGLIAYLNAYDAKFDWRNTCVACPFGAYLEDRGNHYCLKPDHYKDLNRAAETAAAQKNEHAAQKALDKARKEAAKNGEDLAGVLKLESLKNYELIETNPTNSNIAGCTEDCPCRAKAIDRNGTLWTICTDAKRFQQLKSRHVKASKKAARAELEERAARVQEAITSTSTARAWSVLIGQILSRASTKHREAISRQFGVALPSEDFGYSGDMRNVWARLERLDAKALIGLAVGVLVKEEVEGKLDWEARKTDIMDYLLHEEAAAEPRSEATSETEEDEEADDSDTLRCVRCSAVIPMDALGGAVLSETPYARHEEDDTRAARYLDTGLLIIGLMEGDPDDVETTHGVYCADCVKAGVAVCRGCGCTDEVGCPEGCSWVEADLCSSCVPVATPDEFSDPECQECHQRRALPGLEVCKGCLDAMAKEAVKEAVLA